MFGMYYGFYHGRAIRNLKMSEDNSRVDFDVVYYEGDINESEPFKVHYHTNREGEGLWEGYGNLAQVVGTCDFNLRQRTKSGKYFAIRRRFF